MVDAGLETSSILTSANGNGNYVVGIVDTEYPDFNGNLNDLSTANQLAMLILKNLPNVQGNLLDLSSTFNVLLALDVSNSKVYGDISSLIGDYNVQFLHVENSDIFLTSAGEPDYFEEGVDLVTNVDADYFVNDLGFNTHATKLYFCSNLDETTTPKQSEVETKCFEQFGGDASNDWDGKCFFTVPATMSHCQ